MRRIISLLVLLIASVSTAIAAPVTLSGRVTDKYGATYPNSLLVWTVMNCVTNPTVPGMQFRNPFAVNADADGVISGTIASTQDIQCGSTPYYQVSAYSHTGTYIWTRNYQTSGSSFNISTEIPLTTVPNSIAYVQINPSGQGLQSIQGPLGVQDLIVDNLLPSSLICTDGNKQLTTSGCSGGGSGGPLNLTIASLNGFQGSYDQSTSKITLSADGTHYFPLTSDKSNWDAKQASLGFTPENVAKKNAVNGYAGLDSNGRISANQLGTGTASSSTILYGDGHWGAAPSGGSGSANISIASLNGFTGNYDSGTGAITLNVDGTHYLPLATDVSSWNAKQAALGFTPENSSLRNAANGYAGLDANSHISPSQLGSGTASASTILYGDGHWGAAPSGGGSGSSAAGAAGAIQISDGSGGFAADTALSDGSGHWTGLKSILVEGTSGQILSSGVIDGKVAVSTTTATAVSVGEAELGPCSDGTTARACDGEFFLNKNASNATVTYTLPPATSGSQYCFRNDTGVTSIIVIDTSGTGQVIDLQGTNTADAGNITSAGAAGDAACVYATGTQWYAMPSYGSWTRN